MHEIGEVNFYCDRCKHSIAAHIYSDDMNELSDKLKESCLNHLKSDHEYDAHIYCWKCKKHIRVEQIKSMVPLPNGQAGKLCKECTDKYGIGFLCS